LHRVEDYIEKYPKFWDEQALPIKDHWRRINQQVTNHSVWQAENHLIGRLHPSEEDEIFDYRNKNWRRMTARTIQKFKSKVARVFLQSDLQYDYISEQLRGHLESKPFYQGNERLDFFKWMYLEVLGRTIDDPNGGTVNMPYAEDEHGDIMPPNEQFSNQPVKIKYINLSSRYIWGNRDVLGFWNGDMETIDEKNQDIQKLYWILDSER